MRKALVLGAAVAVGVLALAGCGSGTDVLAATRPAQPEGTWLTTEVTSGGAARELVEPGHLSLQFLPDDRVSARGGCNALGGALRLDDGRFWIDDAGSTMMGCPGSGRHEQDQWMGEFFAAGPAYTFDGTRLDLRTEKIRIAFAPLEVVDPDRAFEGPQWEMTHVTTGPPPGAAPDEKGTASAGMMPANSVLVFSPGKARGTVGCVELSGPAERSGDTVTFGTLVVARTGCGDEDQATADDVLAVLSGPVTFDIEAGRMSLTHPSGRGVQLYARP